MLSRAQTGGIPHGRRCTLFSQPIWGIQADRMLVTQHRILFSQCPNAYRRHTQGQRGSGFGRWPCVSDLFFLLSLVTVLGLHSCVWAPSTCHLSSLSPTRDYCGTITRLSSSLFCMAAPSRCTSLKPAPSVRPVHVESCPTLT